MNEIIKKLKQMQKKSFNILNGDFNEIVDIVYSLDNDYENIIEEIELEVEK